MAEPSDDKTIAALDSLRETLGEHDCVALLVCRPDDMRVICDAPPPDVEQMVFGFLGLVLENHPDDPAVCDNCEASIARLRNVFALLKSQLDATDDAAPLKHLH